MSKEELYRVKPEVLLTLVFSKIEEIIPLELDQLIEKMDIEVDNAIIERSNGKIDDALCKYPYLFRQRFYELDNKHSKNKGWRYVRSDRFYDELSEKKRNEILSSVPSQIFKDMQASIKEFTDNM